MFRSRVTSISAHKGLGSGRNCGQLTAGVGDGGFGARQFGSRICAAITQCTKALLDTSGTAEARGAAQLLSTVLHVCLAVLESTRGSGSESDPSYRLAAETNTDTDTGAGAGAGAQDETLLLPVNDIHDLNASDSELADSDSGDADNSALSSGTSRM